MKNSFFLSSITASKAAMHIPEAVTSEWKINQGGKLLLWVDDDYTLVVADPKADHFLMFTPDSVRLNKDNRIYLPQHIQELYVLDKPKGCFVYYFPALAYCRIKINCSLSNSNVVPFSGVTAK